MSDQKKRKEKKEKIIVTMVSRLSIREFEALLIILKNDGEELAVLKAAIDSKFKLESRTKGYDYIRNLCNKKFTFKKISKPTDGGKRTVRICVEKNIRREYEKLILPTIKNLNESIKKLSDDYMIEIKEEKKLMEKFRTYTETILKGINHVLEDTPSKNLNKKKLERKIGDTIWRYFRAEMLRIEMFTSSS
ncbi:MAG: hypothetical protein ACTSQU_01535 [Promethearchaeota archaeon]